MNVFERKLINTDKLNYVGVKMTKKQAQITLDYLNSLLDSRTSLFRLFANDLMIRRAKRRNFYTAKFVAYAK